MKLKLKEDPREWRKFALVAAVFAAGVLWLIARRQPSWRAGLLVIFGLTGTALLAGLIRPRLVRPVYRAAMTASFHVGQVMGRVILAIFFLCLLTPLALFLRAMGKDLLRLKRDSNARTYWQPAKSSDDFDRQF